jgi:hypothetical protein
MKGYALQLDGRIQPSPFSVVGAARQPVSERSLIAPGTIMTAEQRYLLDLQGYIVLKEALSEKAIGALLSDWSLRAKNRPLFDISFSWNPSWAALADNPFVLPVINPCVGGASRIDHAFGITEAFTSTTGRLHHSSSNFRRATYYVVQKGQIHTSLLTVSFALTAVGIDDSGFCCIPGSHKSDFETPSDYFPIKNNPLVVQVLQEAGDAIVFTEALTHGTFQGTTTRPRRSVLIRYCPGYIQFRKAYQTGNITRLPPTPRYFDPADGAVDTENLTETQRQLVAEPAYAVDEQLRDRIGAV